MGHKSGLAERERIGYGLFMPVVVKHRFNTREYYQMAKAGVLKPDARVELLDGEILDMSPIGPFHVRTQALIAVRH